MNTPVTPTGHTPGPWYLIADDPTYPAMICDPADNDLAQVYSRANARLMAAAPELLAALENLVERFHACCIFADNNTEMADAAVADARAAVANAKARECVR